MNLLRPEQRLRMPQKDKDWREKNVIYWAGRTNLYPIINSDAIALYAAAAGKLDESIYTYVTNPLNTKKPELLGYPAKMRNIDIISGNILRLMGELQERLFNPIVVAINSDLQSQKEETEYKLNLDQLKQNFVNGLVEAGLLPKEIAQTPMPDSIIQKTVSNLKDQLAIMGQQAIDVILQDKEIDKIRRKTIYDFIVLSRFFTYRDIKDNDLVYDWISPLEISFTNTPSTYFVEDSEAVKRAVTLPLSQIMDMFADVEEFQDLIPELEQRLAVVGYQSVYTGISTDLLRGDSSQPFTTLTEGLFVEHINWTSLKLCKRVTGKDMFGNEYEEEQYDEDYIPLPTEEVEEYWVNEKWEGYRIDGKHIIGVEPLEFQRGTYENPNKCKNLYNGRIFLNNYVIPQSIIEKGIIYQIKYNIVHYRLEEMMNKNLDKLVVFPLGIMPKKEGWDEFTTMYYARANGFLFADETDPQVLMAMQYMKSIDMSLLEYIKEMYQILQEIKADWDDSIGFNRQRKGQNMASDGKAVNEEAISRSATSSEEFFKEHEETIVKDLQCLMDLSKVAWQKGKKGAYTDSDFKTVYYNFDPTVYPFSAHSIFVENSSKTTRQVEMMQAQLGNIAQQTQDLSILPRIAQATNLSKLTEQIDAIQKKLEDAQKAKEQAENSIKQAEIEDKEKDRQLKIYEIDENNAVKREGDLLKAESLTLGLGKGEEGITDTLELENLASKRLEHIEKLQLEREKLEEARKARMSKEKVEREKMQNDLKISKNKTSSNK